LDIAEKDIGRFAEIAITRLRPWRTTTAMMQEIAEWINRYTSRSASPSNTPVKIMTFQGAKGLDADRVCVVGLEEGTLPRGEDQIDEQARLLYVCMTRAKEELHLFHCRKRSGAISYQNVYKGVSAPGLKPSRFLKAIPEKYLTRIYHQPKAKTKKKVSQGGE
jgi:superfamily I DNA/RNA helicase